MTVRETAAALAVACFAASGASALAKFAPKSGPADGSAALFGDYLTGRTAQLDHDWRTAAQAMMRVWKADPTDTQVRHDALLLSVSAGDFPDAVALAGVIPADSPDATLAHFVLAIDSLADARYAAAAAKLASMPADGINRYLVPMLTAWTAVGLGHKQEAMTALAALDNIPGAMELRDAQRAMIADAIGDRAEAETLYAKMMMATPQPRQIVLAAGFYQRQNKPDLARAAIEKLDPDGQSGSLRVELLRRLAEGHAPPAPDARSGAADALFEIAASLASGQNQREVAPLLYTEMALRLRPAFPSAELLLAEFDYRWDRLDDAVSALMAIDEKSELRSTAERVTMIDLDRTGAIERAQKIGQAAVKAHPEDIDLLLSYADLLRMRAHYADALAVYDNVLARPTLTNNRRGLALFHRGMTQQRADHWSLAEADLLAALKLRPNDASLLNYLAFAWAERGENLDQARTMLERAIQLEPDDGAIIDSLGWVMFQAGDYSEAISQLEHAVQLDAGDATINDHLGDAYWRAGRLVEARAQWERAAHLTDDKALADQIKMKIRDGLAEGAPPRNAAAN